MRFLYSFGVHLMHLGIKIASLWNHKAKLWVVGRRGVLQNFRPMQNTYWFHCASLGEFEQAIPVIEYIKIQNADNQILLTFFSPSGKEYADNYKLADQIIYLPVDTKRNAELLIAKANIKKAFFVKYELWYHYLNALKTNKIDTYLISASFRNNHRYFRWYGTFFKKMLLKLNHIFVQEAASLKLLQENGVTNCSESGDTRYDRVKEIPHVPFSDIKLAHFCSDQSSILVLGSSWPHEEEILQKSIKELINWKVIIAPHDIKSSRIDELTIQFKGISQLYSNYDEGQNCQILIIDNIGMLSKLYRYGCCAFIGGGFSDALHNILEPASYDIPVAFGPKHKHFREAQDMIDHGSAQVIEGNKDLIKFCKEFSSDSSKNGAFIKERAGATAKIMTHINKK